MHPRLQGLVDIFPYSNILLDIGSDHGLLGLELLKKGKAFQVINVDLSKKSLAQSRITYISKGYENQAQFIFSDGFLSLPRLPDGVVVVIAGLGSSQILKILENIPPNVKHLILLSHTDYYSIRKWAFANSWFIKKEKYIQDNKSFVYLILDLVKSSSSDHQKPEDYIFGREEFWATKKSLFIKYWIPRVKRISNIPYEYRDQKEIFTLSFLKKRGLV